MSVTSGEFFFTAFQLEPVLFAYIATVIQLDSAAKNASFRSHRSAGNNRVITFYNLVIERGKLFYRSTIQTINWYLVGIFLSRVRKDSVHNRRVRAVLNFNVVEGRKPIEIKLYSDVFFPSFRFLLFFSLSRGNRIVER